MLMSLFDYSSRVNERKGENMLSLLAIMPFLSYSAYTDFKRREIPNLMALSIFLIGIAFCFFQKLFPYLEVTLFSRFCGLFLPLMVLVPLYFINPNLSGGGDLKLLIAMGFTLGLPTFLTIYSLSAVIIIPYCLLKKKSTLPLAPFLFGGSLLFFICSFLYAEFSKY